jgi:hypothetical protein
MPRWASARKQRGEHGGIQPTDLGSLTRPADEPAYPVRASFARFRSGYANPVSRAGSGVNGCRVPRRAHLLPQTDTGVLCGIRSGDHELILRDRRLRS